jgi:hypothetical protein
VQDDENSGWQVGRQSAENFLQRLNTACRRSDRD